MNKTADEIVRELEARGLSWITVTDPLRARPEPAATLRAPSKSESLQAIYHRDPRRRTSLDHSRDSSTNFGDFAIQRKLPSTVTSTFCS